MPPAARKPRARRYDPKKTRAAVPAQFGHLQKAVRALTPEQLDRPALSGDRTAGESAARAAMALEDVCRLLEQPAPLRQEIALVDWPSASGPPAGGGDEAARSVPAKPAVLLDRAADRYAELVPAAPDGRLLATGSGAMRLDDFLVTCCVRLVLHTDDLARATGQDIPSDRQALATTTRLLADALAHKAPGNSVEVRVPPFAVVQCVEGPKHTRGTPPNVVETDPLTWLRLATGRTTWSAAREAAEVSASGERADIGGYLPVLR
ncbi:sterol carrier family protein [Streptomyces sp. NPDC017993]|uniref:sterol carrier family protein n=1 Tax=Streptomyces sp. NPDC017993 TaxID=3365027 RepID=UPI00378E865C